MQDPSFFSRLFYFGNAVFNNWFGWLTGIILVLEQIAELFFPSFWVKVDRVYDKPSRRKILLWLCLIAFTVSSFQAFDSVSERLRSTQNSLNAIAVNANLSIPRHIPTDARAKGLSFLLKRPLLKSFQTLYMSSSMDNDSGNYETEIYRLSKEIGLHPEGTPMGTQAPGDTGIIIYLVDVNHPSQAAIDMCDLAAAMGFAIKKELWWDRDGWPPTPDFFFYVTRDQPVPK